MFNTDMVNTREFNESPNLRLSVSDTISISESFSRVAEFFRTFNDNISISEGFSKISEFFRTFSDNVYVLESHTRAWAAHLSISDTVSITDSIGTRILRIVAATPKVIGAILKKVVGGSAKISKPERDL